MPNFIFKYIDYIIKFLLNNFDICYFELSTIPLIYLKLKLLSLPRKYVFNTMKKIKHN